MEMKQFKITCLKCKGSNNAMVTKVSEYDYSIDLNPDHRRNPDNIHIISGRYRSDMEMGWECLCGNDSRVSQKEKGDIGSLVKRGDPKAIEKIVESLNTKDEKKFTVVPA